MTMLLEKPDELRDWKRQVLWKVRWHLSRREFLRAAVAGSAALAGAALLPGSMLRSASGQTTARSAHGAEVSSAPASGPAATMPGKPPKAVKTGTFYFPRLLFHVKDETGDQWNTDPVGDAILRQRLIQLTNINASPDPVVVKLADLDSMCRYPFVFATSEGYFDLPANETKNLKEFLLRGGFVHADDCVLGKTGDRFFRDYVKMINNLFPENPMKRIPNDHELYNIYFNFPDGCPHLQGIPHGAFGLFEKGTGRIMTICTPGDLHCGWMCRFFKPDENEAALRMGINIVIYYLTH
jgi:hypothetical protein